MQPQDARHPPQSEAGAVVLDTNVVLALYWFQDPHLGRLARALQAGQLRWLATSEMRQELVHVLDRPRGDQATRGLRRAPHEDGPGVQAMLQMFDSLAVQVTASPAGPTPRCTDGTDQKFIDLALSSRSLWLLSRDRAVLKLRRKLLAMAGCTVQRPEDWPG
ncbi:MAG: PIN domain-containing protein [Betaproteobacteria bacterium]